MASLSLLSKGAIPLTVHEALSGIFGSTSLACWIFLLLPQLYENYKAQSGESISLVFLSVWFIGDITNLAGAAWADLVPTVIALAIYFCIMDLVLIGQCLYYKFKSKRSGTGDVRRISEVSVESEDEPLLSRRDSNISYSSTGLPGSTSRRKSSAASAAKRARKNSIANIPEEYADYVSGTAREALKNLASILFVFAVGAVGWTIAWRTRWWTPQPQPDQEIGSGGKSMPLGAEVLGYASAVCYLGARLPQIYKNYKEKSCAGLSLLFFILSLLGNLTYGIGILAHSLEKQYVLTNLPWLIGSLGTMFEDITIFIQFRIYGDKSAAQAIVED